MIRIKLLNQKDAVDARDFCLSQIKTEYGYDYSPSWHSDLDSLKIKNSMYYKNSQGVFYIVFDKFSIIASIGFRNIKYKQSNCKLVKEYFNFAKVGSIWRTYTLPKYRSQGIASKLVAKAEKDARTFNYEMIYLHTSRNKPNSLTFWQNRGYKIFKEEQNEDRTVHMFKVIF
jgi:GNAT superfamily N-acetyltransferase